jgi:RNA polymerase sigma-70 factor (ECF subfamily)
MHTLSDQKLIKAYLNGSSQAFTILFNRHQPKIYSSIFLFVRCHEKANDIFQETFIKVVDKLQNKGYNESDKFLPWVMRIARNLCIDDYRSNKRVRILHSTEDKDIFRAMPSEITTSEDILVQSQTCEQVKNMIDLLPIEQKEVVIMRHYYGLKFNEIAEETGENLNTVLGRMRYALKNLRKIMEEESIEI